MSPRGERIFEMGMATLALFSVALICLEYLFVLSPAQVTVIYSLDLAVCVIFAVEFGWRLKVSQDRKGFLKAHWFEILAMFPAYGFTLMQTQSVFAVFTRSLRLVRLVRLIIIAARLRRVFRTTSWILRRSYLAYLLTVSATIVFVGSIGAYLFERNAPGAAITSIGDAFWWSVTTVTTVGYGDIVPTTPAGRVFGVVLMLVGIAFLGVFISTLGSALTERRLRRAPEGGDDLWETTGRLIQERLGNPAALLPKEIQVLEALALTLRRQRE